MAEPIDKATVVLEIPDELYMEHFDQSARHDARFGRSGVSITICRSDPDEGSSVSIRLSIAVFADILRRLADTVSLMGADDRAQRDALEAAAASLHLALSRLKRGEAQARAGADVPSLTPEEEVLLLHVLE